MVVALVVALALSTNMAGQVAYNTGGGGGGGNTLRRGLFAALPVSGNLGDVYVATDSFYDYYQYNGSAWVAYYQDVPITTPPAGGTYTLLDASGTTTTTNPDGSVIFNRPNGGTPFVTAIGGTIPATPFTWTTCMRMLQPRGANFLSFGAGFYTAGANTGLFYGMFNNGTPGLGSNSTYITTGNFAGNEWNGGGFYFGDAQSVWVRHFDNGVTRVTSISTDGKFFNVVSSVPRTTFITPARWGFSFENSTGQPTQILILSSKFE